MNTSSCYKFIFISLSTYIMDEESLENKNDNNQLQQLLKNAKISDHQRQANLNQQNQIYVQQLKQMSLEPRKGGDNLESQVKKTLENANGNDKQLKVETDGIKEILTQLNKSFEHLNKNIENLCKSTKDSFTDLSNTLKNNFTEIKQEIKKTRRIRKPLKNIQKKSKQNRQENQPIPSNQNLGNQQQPQLQHQSEQSKVPTIIIQQKPQTNDVGIWFYNYWVPLNFPLNYEARVQKVIQDNNQQQIEFRDSPRNSPRNSPQNANNLNSFVPYSQSQNYPPTNSVFKQEISYFVVPPPQVPKQNMLQAVSNALLTFIPQRNLVNQIALGQGDFRLAFQNILATQKREKNIIQRDSPRSSDQNKQPKRENSNADQK